MTAPRPGLLIGALACAASCLCLTASAQADLFGPISLASVGSPGGGSEQQAEYAHDATVSADGRYVAFDGSVGGVTGVWRRSLVNGSLEQVAGGAAELPSLSADGETVSFTTNEGASLAAETDARPVTVPHREAANVYVRDMAIAPGEEGAFRVASAATGSQQPLTYAGAGTTLGSEAVGRSAISADGEAVAFVTTAVSDLQDPETPGNPTTPAYQVAVRHLSSGETTLVSTDRTTGGPVSAVAEKPVGAVFAGKEPGFKAPPLYAEWAQSPPVGASISADGTAVAWMGTDIVAQAPMLPGESPPPLYTEPLWKRIAPGSETPTERVTGGSDPAAPGCAESGEQQLPASNQQSPSDPCLGPFIVALTPSGGSPPTSGIWPTAGGEASGVGDFVPRLSADGYEVAFLSEAEPKGAGANFGIGSIGEPADLYRADMHAGLTRDQATSRITELAAAGGIAETDQITEFAISPDGAQVAFTTRRTQFPLSSPAFISAALPEPGLNELYDADLADSTLTRVTAGYEGGPSEQPHKRLQEEEDQYGASFKGAGAASPEFTGDGGELAFASTASNLVFGDGNTPPSGPADGSDAFLVQRLIETSVPTGQGISPTPQLDTKPSWSMGVTAKSRADGSVVLYVTAPGAGSLRAGAQSTIALGKGRAARRASRGRQRAAGARRRVLVSRAVASAQREVPATAVGSATSLVLKLKASYASRATSAGGLSAIVTVALVAQGHPTLRQSIEVTFLRRASKAAKRASAHRRRR
jgi:hypothetical protein